MYKAYKYRIYPNKEQQRKMNQFFGCCRFVYNKCLEWYDGAYKQLKNDGTDIGKTPLLTEFKKDYQFLKDCDNAAIAYARTNFEKALSNFFKSRKGERKGKKLGFPKFKSKNKSKAIYRTCDAHGTIRFIDDNHIRLPKLGSVKVVKHREFNGVIKAVTVERKPSGKFYISVMVECSDGIQLKINKKSHYQQPNVVGLDMSMSDFAVSSHSEDNTITKYARNYRKEEQKLKRLQRKVSRTEKDSRNRFKVRRKAAALHERIANRRRDFCIKAALYYARKYDVVVLEDINLQDMSRTLHLGKSVTDLGFGMFRQLLEWKAQEYDCTVIKADKWFPSSKLCSVCGEKNTLLQLSDREWVCSTCGTVHNRDFNAATNLEHYFNELYYTAGTAEIQACGERSSTLRGTVAQVLSLNQEAPSFR